MIPPKVFAPTLTFRSVYLLFFVFCTEKIIINIRTEEGQQEDAPHKTIALLGSQLRMNSTFVLLQIK